MKIISRSEAIEQGLKKFYTGEPCIRGHFSPRYVSSRNCIQCSLGYEIKKTKGVYQILNTANNKCYIGSSAAIKIRWSEHKNTLRANKNQSVKLQRAWNKYGEESFQFIILEVVDGDKEELYKKEQFYMDKFNSIKNGYNVRPSAASNLGYRHTKKAKEKMSKGRMGKNNPMYGKIVSEETRLKHSIIHRRENLSQETLEKMSKATSGKNNANYGKTPSEDTRKKMSEARKKRVCSDETRAKLSKSGIGRKHTEASKTKMSESMKKRWAQRKALKTIT
jgi:hypothetical protein